jgi:hypothetical protein
MNSASLTARILLGAAIALSARIAAGGVGDLTPTKSMPSGVSVHDGAMEQMYTPANPKALGLTHPKAMIASGDMPIKVAFDADDAKADVLNTVRINVTGKGGFADAVTVKLVRARGAPAEPTTLTFGPRLVTITKADKKFSALLAGEYRKTKTRVSGYVVIKAFAEGTVRFGKAIRKVRVLDSNDNLTLGDVVIIKPGNREFRMADHCRVANDKGKFTTSSGAVLVQMGRPIQIDGKWYTLTCGDMKITAKSLADRLGTLSVDAPRWQCLLSADNYTLTITGGDKPVDVPAGEYRVQRLRLYQQAGADGAGPSISRGRTKPLTIAPGKAASLSPGSNITATMATTVTTDKKTSRVKVRFSVSQADEAGWRISKIYGADGKRPTAPQIEVLDKAGKVIYIAKLAYG